jgi:curved DNA-binding protein CbpA
MRCSGALAATVGEPQQDQFPAGRRHRDFSWKDAVAVKDHYATLGLRSDATVGDVRKAFRALAFAFHPDRNSDPAAPQRFREAQQAYEVLSDHDLRAAYDANRRRNLLDNPLDTAREIWAHYLDTVLAQLEQQTGTAQ